MKSYLKIGGITKQWIKRVFLLSVAIILLIVILLCGIVSQIIDSNVKNTASSYALVFHKISASNADEFETAAIQLAESFENRDKIEIQAISANGRPIVSTSGYISNYDVELAEDYKIAVSNNCDTVTLKYRTPQKEKVMATTYIVKNSNGEVLGAYRWIVSLKNVNNYRLGMFAFIIGCALFIIVITSVSGIVFVNSIEKPLAEVTNTARKIAAGKFDERNLDIDRNDEIGDLCNAVNFMADELSTAENMKNDFISSVSHELRTPLTAIKGWGETAKISIGQDDEIVKKGMDVILKEAERLSGLVEELLDFSRMQSGRLTVNTEEIDIGKTVEEVFMMYAELAAQQKIEITYIKPENEVLVMADKNRIKQVFINIVDNAIKYSNEGGHVIISTETEENCIRIIISDTGVGIAAEHISHVKEKFYKANKLVRGSGIGLAVADEIIKQHNGLLFVESTEGVGTSVTIVLPTIERKDEVTAVYFPPKQEDGEEVQPVENIEQIISGDSEDNE